MNNTRPPWHQYFLEIAHIVAMRSTCTRLHVGAVIADEHNRVISCGYNGSPAGTKHCTDEGIGCLIKDIGGRPSCIRTIHAEANALAYASSSGVRGGSIYVTVTPCYDCAKLIIQAGIKHVVYAKHYDSRSTELVLDLFREANVQVEQIKLAEETQS